MPPGEFGYIEGERLGKPYDLGLLKKFLPYLWPWRAWWLLILLLALAVTALDLVPPFLTKQAIDRYILRGDLRGLQGLALALLLVLVVGYGLQYTQVVIMERLGQRVMHALRLDLVRRLLSLPLPFYQHHPVGRLVTRATNDIENLNEMVKSLLATLVKDVLLFLGIAGVLFYLDSALALITFAVIPVIFLAARLFSRQARDAFRDLRRWMAQLNAVIQETINGLPLIQLLRGEERRYEVFREANHQTFLAGMKQIQVFALFMPLMEFLSAGAIGLLLWYGGGQVIQEKITLGALVAFLAYIQMFFRPLRELTEKYSVMQSAMASLERIFDLMAVAREPDPPSAIAPEVSKVQGAIDFRRVSFAYDPGQWILKDISLSIPAGETVAVVGMTGGGKTTLIKLLAGFYEPQQGEIRIDGREIRTFPKQALRSLVGLVPQEVFLFEGDPEYNIFLGEDREQEAHQAVLRESPELQDLLRSLTGRPVSTLSAGERQLVALARVLVRNPRVLVLDEATAHIDARTEEQVQHLLRRLLAGRTSIIIAHRLFTLRQATRIVVLQEGRLVEEGSHEELMELKGYYYRLYQLQFASVNGEAFSTPSLDGRGPGGG
jgi:ATP-binding cassette subfamily B protein